MPGQGREDGRRREGARRIRIASTTNLTNIKYEEWVENNRDSVDKATNGQIAYVHIRAMDQPSLERFQNEIDRFWQKKGIIVDIRNNGGGNIDQELLDILERQPYQFWNNRNGSRTWGRRPRQAIVGPKVMMINYRSVSDAEVTPPGFRQLGLGRIVGNPTSAQVIATGSYALINGGAIRTPGSLVVTGIRRSRTTMDMDLGELRRPARRVGQEFAGRRRQGNRSRAQSGDRRSDASTKGTPSHPGD